MIPLVQIYDGAATLIRSVTSTDVVMGPSRRDTAPLIIVHPYVLDDAVTVSPDSIIGLQVRIRHPETAGLPAPLTDQQAIFDRLHLAKYLDYSGVRVALTWRQASAILGLDAQGRPEITDTYYLRGISAAH